MAPILPRPFNILPGGKPPKPQIRAALAGSIKHAQSLTGHILKLLQDSKGLPDGLAEGNLELAQGSAAVLIQVLADATTYARDLGGA